MDAKEKVIQVNFYEMLKFIAYKWRIIFAWGILVAMLFACITFGKNVAANKYGDSMSNQDKSVKKSVKESNNQEIDSDLTIEDILEGYVTSKEISRLQADNIKNALNMYLLFTKYYGYLDAADLRDNCFRPNRVILQYVIKVTSNEINSLGIAESVSTSLKQYILSGGILSSLSEMGYDISDNIDSEDLFIVENEDGGTNGEKLSTNVLEVFENCKNNVLVVPFCISCKGNTNDDALELADYAKNILETYFENYQKLGNVELVLLDEYTGSGEDTSFLTKKQNLTQTVYSLYSQFLNCVSNFSDKQKAIFNKVYGEDILQVENDEIEKNIEDNINTVSISPCEGMTKNICLGLILGIFISILGYIIWYILDDSVKTDEEFTGMYEIYCIGNIKKENVSNRWGCHVDRILDKVFRGDKYLKYNVRKEMLVANVRVLSQEKNIKTLHIVPVFDLDEKGREEINEVIESLKTYGIDIGLIEKISSDALMFEKFVKTDNIILLEKPMKSKYKEIEYILEICKIYKVNVVGAIGC